MTLNMPEIPMFAGRMTVVYHMTHPSLFLTLVAQQHMSLE